MGYKKRWRPYQNAAGACPVRRDLKKLTAAEQQVVAAGMADVAENGLEAARHLEGDIYEVRAEGPNRSFRLLFSAEARGGHILLALHVYEKRRQKLLRQELAVAQERLADWRACGDKKRRNERSGRTR